MAKPIHLDVAGIVRNQPLFDRALGAIAPGWGRRRLENRVLKHLFEYQAAQYNEHHAPKTRENAAESAQTTRDRHVLMWESRDLVHNFALIASIPEKYALHCTPREWSPATGDRHYDRLVADYFHAWCRRCDLTGRHSFRQLIGLALQMQPVDGDCGFIQTLVGDEWRLQLIEGDRLGNPHDSTTQQNYIDGITVDEVTGQPTHFRVFQRNRNGGYDNPRDIPAKFFHHFADPYRHDQYRGVSEFHSVITTARMLKGILEAEQVGVRFASQQAALVFNERASASTRNAFTPTVGQTLADGTTRKDELSNIGLIKYFNTADKVEVMPGRPSSAFAGFVEHLMHEISVGTGIPMGVLYGFAAYKGPNVRAEFAQADRVFARKRSVLDDRVLSPIKDAVIRHAIVTGALPMPPDKAGESPIAAIARACRGEWRWPAKMTIDAGRESAAALNEHRQGLRSGQQIAAEQDYDYFQALEGKAIEAARIKELSDQYGVPETAIQLVTTSIPSTPAAAASLGENAGVAASEAEAARMGDNATASFSIEDRMEGRAFRLAHLQREVDALNELHAIINPARN